MRKIGSDLEGQKRMALDQNQIWMFPFHLHSFTSCISSQNELIPEESLQKQRRSLIDSKRLTFSASSSIWRSSLISSRVRLFFRQFDDTGRSTVDRALMFTSILTVWLWLSWWSWWWWGWWWWQWSFMMMMTMTQWSVEGDMDNIKREQSSAEIWEKISFSPFTPSSSTS